MSTCIELKSFASGMARVYISSSYVDLAEERQAVMDILVSRRHQAVGMEQYRASPTPPLDKCVRDVESCSCYFGIFAFRYGFCPKGKAKCITELEYEAALDKKIPPFIFMLQEHAEWPIDRVDTDRANVERLRNRLKIAHTVKFFATREELVKAVKDVVDEDLGSGRSFDPNLPFRCDREPQELKLGPALTAAAMKKRRPTILLIHGDDEQEHDRFKSRLVNDLLPAELSGGKMRQQVKDYVITCPDKPQSEAEFKQPYLRQIGDKVGRNPKIQMEQARDAIAAIPAAVVLCSYCRSAEGVNMFVDFWRQFPDLPDEHQGLLAVLFIQYARSTGWLARWREPAAYAIRESLKPFDVPNGATPCSVLPPLDDIGLVQAENWARSDEVSRDWDSAVLIDGIRTLFITRFGKKNYQQGRMSMKELAGHLALLLGKPIEGGA